MNSKLQNIQDNFKIDNNTMAEKLGVTEDELETLKSDNAKFTEPQLYFLTNEYKVSKEYIENGKIVNHIDNQLSEYEKNEENKRISLKFREELSKYLSKYDLNSYVEKVLKCCRDKNFPKMIYSSGIVNLDNYKLYACLKEKYTLFSDDETKLSNSAKAKNATNFEYNILMKLAYFGGLQDSGWINIVMKIADKRDLNSLLNRMRFGKISWDKDLALKLLNAGAMVFSDSNTENDSCSQPDTDYVLTYLLKKNLELEKHIITKN